MAQIDMNSIVYRMLVVKLMETTMMSLQYMIETIENMADLIALNRALGHDSENLHKLGDKQINVLREFLEIYEADSRTECDRVGKPFPPEAEDIKLKVIARLDEFEGKLDRAMEMPLGEKVNP